LSNKERIGGSSFSSLYFSFPTLYSAYIFCNFKFNPKTHFFYILLLVCERGEIKSPSFGWRERNIFFSNWSLLCLICQKISREEKLKEREPNCKTRRNTMANVKLGGQSSFSSSYFSFSNFIVPIIFVISNLTKKNLFLLHFSLYKWKRREKVVGFSLKTK